MGELAESTKELDKALDKVAKRSIEKGLGEDKEYFSKIRALFGNFGWILMDLRVRGLIEPEVAEELLQLRKAK